METLDAITLSNAMVAAAQQHATAFESRGAEVHCNAWWRGGDGLKVCIYVERATWKDIKSGDSGGARDFARVALGCSLKEMLERYGSLPAAPRTATSVLHAVDARDGWTPDLVTATWERHVVEHTRCGGCPTCLAGGTCPSSAGELAAREWLQQTRGIPTSARMESGLLPADPALFPAEVQVERRGGGISSVRDWVADVHRGMGPAFLVPLRCAAQDDGAKPNRVVGLVLRLAAAKQLNGTTFKSLTVKGIRQGRSPLGPWGFGWAGAALRSSQLLVVEGAPDTWAAEALAPSGTVVVGVNGVEQLRGWAEWLKQRRLPTVFIPQLDAAPHVSQTAFQAAAKATGAAGVPSRLFPWGAFKAELEAFGISMEKVKDLADVTRAAAQEEIPWSVISGAFQRRVKQSMESLHAR